MLEVRRVRHVRAAAQVDEGAVSIGRDDFVAALEIIEALELERIVGEAHARLGQRHLFAQERILLGHDLLHLGFERGQIVGRERLLDFEIVVEAIIDGGAETDFGVGAQAAHRRGQDMGPGVTQHLHGAWVFLRDDHEGTRCPQWGHEVEDLAIHRHRQRRLQQARPDRADHIARQRPGRDLASGAVGQCQDDVRVGSSVSSGLRTGSHQERAER